MYLFWIIQILSHFFQYFTISLISFLTMASNQLRNEDSKKKVKRKSTGGEKSILWSAFRIIDN